MSDGRCSLATAAMAAYAIGILTAFTDVSREDPINLSIIKECQHLYNNLLNDCHCV